MPIEWVRCVRVNTKPDPLQTIDSTAVSRCVSRVAAGTLSRFGSPLGGIYGYESGRVQLISAPSCMTWPSHSDINIAKAVQDDGWVQIVKE